MTHGDQTAIIANAVAGRTLSEIARAAGTSISTVQRRLREPAIRAEIRELRWQHRQELQGGMNQLSTRAVQLLGEILEEAEDMHLVLRVAALVLSSATRLAQVTDIEERLALLEHQAAAEEDEDTEPSTDERPDIRGRDENDLDDE